METNYPNFIFKVMLLLPTIFFTASAIIPTIFFTASALTIECGSSGNYSSVCNGSNDSDVIHGTALREKITGLNGDDILYGEGGNDEILAGEDNDVVYGGPDDDVISGGNGSDTLFAEAGANVINGDNGDDFISGGGRDVLKGDNGNDTIIAVNDSVINGGNDNDTILGSSGSDKILGEAGYDTISGGGGSDILIGGPNNDVIYDGNYPAMGDGFADIIDCGPGDRDTVYMRVADGDRQTGCEIINNSGESLVNGSIDTSTSHGPLNSPGVPTMATPSSATVIITNVKGDNGEVILSDGTTTSNSIIFSFTLFGSRSGLHAECQLTNPGDNNPTFEQCDSNNRQTYNDISFGTHTFVVRAVDDTGIGESQSFTWTKINAGGGGAEIAK